jgi:hypothetical protein
MIIFTVQKADSHREFQLKKYVQGYFSQIPLLFQAHHIPGTNSRKLYKLHITEISLFSHELEVHRKTAIDSRPALVYMPCGE